MAVTTAEHDRAVLYQRSRPPYAAAVVDFAAEHADGALLAVVADIGCGTGLSTLPFRAVAASLIGVEPDAEMRARAVESLSAIDATVVAGSAEATGLADSSVDLLVAASCFEWFDLSRAAREFRRVLNATGHVLLMWNHRAVVDPVSEDWDRLWLRHMGPRLGPAPSDIDNALVPAFLAAGFRRFRQVEHHNYDRARLHEFAFSSGYAPRQSQVRRRRALAEAIDDFHAAHVRNKAVALAFETVAFVGIPRYGLE